MDGSTKDLIIELVRTNFKLKYRGSVLGFIWVLMKPFLLFLIMFLIFSYLNQGVNGLTSQQFTINLLIGLVIFYFFNDGIIYGMNSLLDKAGIILKVNFNRRVAVFSSIFLALINFIINAVIIAVVSIFVGVGINFSSALYLILVIASLFILVTGISFFTSILLVRLRDLTHVAELGMQLLFYASAVFFPIEIVPEKWQPLINLNPIAVLVQAARSAVLFGTIDRWKYVLAIFFFSIILLALGLSFFKKQVKKITEYF